MRTYQVNESSFYIDEPYVKNNTFIGRTAENEELPEYEKIKHLLPEPILDGYDSAIKCYDKVWSLAFKNIKKPFENSGFVTNFIDAAFNGAIFMWDTSFILMFAKYGRLAFDFQKTLDNFYAKQHRDGFICREIRESDGGDYFARHDPISTGPDIMGWCEWEYYISTGDEKRLSKVFDPLMAYHKWYMENRTWRDGSYWSSGWGCGMDNTPRLMEGYDVSFSHGHQVWIDTCFQQVLSAKCLVNMADVLKRSEETEFLKDEIKNLESIINNGLWDDETSFYYDKWRNGKLNGVMSVASYWGLVSGSVPDDRLERFISHLDNKNEFNRAHRVPSLSASDKNFVPSGGYWCGSVWAPTTYMILKGLERCKKMRLAHEIGLNHLKNVAACFEETGTVWENYAPDTFGKNSSARGDFVGWTGLAPVAVLIEYVLGIKGNMKDKKIVWDVNLTCRHGIKKYPLTDGETIDLYCEARKSEDEKPVITKSGADIDVFINWKNGSFKI